MRRVGVGSRSQPFLFSFQEKLWLRFLGEFIEISVLRENTDRTGSFGSYYQWNNFKCHMWLNLCKGPYLQLQLFHAVMRSKFGIKYYFLLWADLNGVYRQQSNGLKFNGQPSKMQVKVKPSKNFKAFQISLFQLIFAAFRLLKNQFQTEKKTVRMFSKTTFYGLSRHYNTLLTC